MQYFVPDYYAEFHCIASACRHSCCVGWEIAIDDDTLARYRRVGGALGRRLDAAIAVDADGAHFRLDSGERCPFLREDGLCTLILALGEDALCQICRDHPRYRNLLAGRTETGLGLCCEAAAELILRRTAPMRWLAAGEDGTVDDVFPEEEALLALRDDAMAILQNRTMPFARRAAVLAEAYAPAAARSPDEWLRVFLGLNPLDPAWQARLAACAAVGQTAWPLPHGEWQIPFEQLAVYFLCRHLPGAAEDGRGAARIAFALLSTAMLALLFFTGPEQSMAALCALARSYSAEIEYDEDNVEAILLELGGEKGAQV